MADKKRTGFDWEDVRTFIAVVRHGSLSSAARSLSVTHATVSRRLQSLESSLGQKLLERRPEGYVLTSAGTYALEAAGGMEHAAELLGRGAADDAPSGIVRINASPAMANGFLNLELAKLAMRHPKLDINLTNSHRFISLERHEADIAIRFGSPEGGDVIARALVTVGYGFYGTDGTCRAAESGARPVFIGFDEAEASMPTALWLTRHFPRSRLAFRANDQFAQSVAARSGAGLALLPHYLGRSDAALRLCDLGPAPPDREVFLLTRRRDKKDRLIRVVADELAIMFKEAKDLFA
ncbi:LysR family transcriptional regulator [Rhizobium sp. SIMBA_035]